MSRKPSFSRTFGRRAFRGSVSVIASLALVAGVTTISPPPAAAAAENGIPQILGVLGSGGDPTHNLAAWTSGLGAIDKLGEPLPLVTASPGGLLGFDDLFAQAVTDELAGASTFDDLVVDKDVSIGGGRAGHLTTTVADEGAGKKLTVTVEVTRSVSKQGLHLASESPKVDLTVSDGVTVNLKSRLTLSVVWTGSAEDAVYLVSGADTPRLDVDATASIDNATAKAAIGILGVDLTGSSLSLKAHLVGSVADPNNDGKLYFSGDPDGGNELAQDGSLAGLFTVGLDPQGSLPIDSSDENSRGSLSATFQLGATKATDTLVLPDGINATIKVTWGDIGTGSPTIEAPDLANTAVGKFQNMSLKDLAAGLAQIVIGIDAIQKAKVGDSGDLDLPFVRGKLSDAVQVSKKLKDFLTAHVDQGTTDPAKTGLPDFDSLQELLKLLEGTTGMTLPELSWDATSSKLVVKLGLEQTAPAEPVDLDKVSAEASGDKATYGAKTLKVDNAGWNADQWIGRRVIAGTSAGEVDHNTADTITLKQDWVGGTPVTDTPYVITGAEPHIGAVTFADQLASKASPDARPQGIVNANADQTFAKVTQSYNATLGLVLDLQNPKTGDDCIGFEGNTKACPFDQTDGAFQTHVDALPLPTDRVMLRSKDTHFTADFPIDSKVDLTANAGFFKVRLQGSLKICNSAKADTCPSGAAGGHMLSIGLKDQGDLRMSQLFQQLVDNPGGLLEPDVNVRAYADVAVSLPEADNFLPPGTTASFTAKWGDLTDPSTISLDTSKLADIGKLDFDPKDPKALFTLLIKTLQTFSSSLAAANTDKGSKVFNREIPGVGKSLRDLLGADEANGGDKVTYGANTVKDDSRSTSDHPFTDALIGRTVVVGTQIGVVTDASDDGKTLTMSKNWDSRPADHTSYAMRSALDDAVDHLLATPPDNIQDAVKLLNAALGTDSVKFRYLATGTTGNLVLDVNWGRGYRVAAPIKLALGSVGGSDRTFAGAEATGTAQIGITGQIKAGLVIPLSPGDGPADSTSLKVLEDSSITLGAKATFNGVVKGVIGPLSIALGNPNGTPKAQAKADLSLKLAKPGAAADTPVSFDTFIGAVETTFNATSGKVDCGESLTTELMVCAKLPMYLNNGSGWSNIGEIDLRLPKSTDPAKLFDFSGNLPSPDDTKPKLQLPTDLADQLKNALLDFANLGDGLEAYLARIEQAFQLASVSGKLPLVGDDLQQGADFIGKLRKTLHDSIWSQLPGGGRPASAEEFKKFIDDHLASALDAAGIAATATVDFTCTETLHPVSGTPTVAATVNPPPVTDPPTPAPPTGTWQYKIVAYQGSGADKTGDTKPSAIGSAQNYKNFELGSFNDVSWNAVDHASGYKVLRKGPNDTEFKQIALKVGGTNTSLHDTTPTGGTPYGADVTVEPKLNPCPLDFVDGVTLTFTAGQGKVDATAGCTDTGATKPCIKPVSIPLDIGIPGLSLRQADGAPGMQLSLGYQLSAKLGLNKQDGFYLAAKAGDNSLKVGLGFDLPANMVAQLAFIKIDVTKTAASAGTKLFAGTFAIDLKSAPGDKITFADIGGKSLTSLVGVALTAKAHLDWLLKAQVDSALPGVQANFQLDWDITNKAPPGYGTPTIAFKDVAISAGSFFTGVLGDAVKLMKKVTGPIQPVVDTLYAPIPVLSDLSKLAGGGDVTLISLAQAFKTVEPALKFVDTIKAITDFIKRLPTCDESTPAKAAECVVPIGDFTLDGDKALATSNSPTTADKVYKAGGINAKTGDQVKTALNGKNDNPAAGSSTVFGEGSDTAKSGFTFPIVDSPSKVFDLIMGSDVTLVEFDSGPLTIGFTWRQDFGPVYAPPPVFVTLAGSASASLRVVAGLDTYGLRKAVEAVQAGEKPDVKVVDGLFLKTVDDNGNPIPVVTLTGEIAAGAAVSAFIIKVGIEGGLQLTITFYWNDPDHDGKFRVTEFGHVAMNNPLCLFTMSGKLSLFLRVYITIGVSIFSTTFSFTLANVTLLDFSVAPDCDPPPPRLGGTSGDTLVVYAGRLGGKIPGSSNYFRGHEAWNNTGDDYVETVKVIALHYAQTDADPQGSNGDFDGFAIEMLGEHREYLDTGLKRVVVDGTDYDKPMVVTFTGDGKKTTDGTVGKDPTQFDKEAVVIGGKQDDQISTGTGTSYVDGGPGVDKIVTHDGSGSRAWVAGGADGDTITVGDGGTAADRNLVAGDASLGEVTKTVDLTPNDEDGGSGKKLSGVSVVDWTQLKDPTGQSGGSNQGDDTIGVGLGANTARGNAGDDRISVAADSPETGGKKAAADILVGDDGSDTLVGGTNADKIFTAAQDEFGVDEDGPSDSAATRDKPNIVYTGEGNDQVWGSSGVDLVNSQSTTSQHATIVGGAGDDVLIGGYGTDHVYGGPGDDYVIADPATVGKEGDPSDPSTRDIINGHDYGPKRTVDKQPLPANTAPSEKVLVGGTGNDHIVGGDGNTTAFGDRHIPAEKCAAGDPVTSDPVAESTNATDDNDGNDLILGGAGVDTVSAGGGDDIGKTFGANDLVCGQEGADYLYGGTDDDHLWGGSGADVLYGETGADHVFGNAGDDTAYGGSGADTMEGNNGADWISGGNDADTIYGGTRAAGRKDTDTSGPSGAAKGDDLYGDNGEDVLIGDNGTVTDPYPYDLDGTVAKAGEGDRIHGGAADDHAYGGLGDDVVNGNDGNDYLEGNNGSDTVHGNAGNDRIIGGSSQEAGAGVGRPDTGDWLYGDAGADLITGDNAQLELVDDAAQATRVTLGRGFDALHKVTLLDLGLTPTAGTSGGDYVSGGDGQDVIYGQDGTDRIKGDADADYAEGGPGIDWIEGDAGDDDLVGGSSTPLSGSGDDRAGQPDAADAIHGGPGDDVVLGDNGRLMRLLAGDDATKATVRLGSTAGYAMTPRIVDAYDLRNGGSLLSAPPSNRYGDDRIAGGEGVDVLYGQDGGDFVSGGAGGDYVEGNGGADVVRGDSSLEATSAETTVLPLADPGWPGAPSAAAGLTGATGPDGQDDVIGGSSRSGFRDGGDTVEANGADDVLLGDNGTLLRTLQGEPGALTEKVYTDRYPNGAVPASATRSRVHDPAAGDVSTRFCSEDNPTCEVLLAFGDDTLYGDDGNDGMWGQDGDDVMYGGAGDDDMFGELGDDTMSGGTGEDAMLGDRGGVVNQYLDEGDDPAAFTVTLNLVPQESFTGFRRGLYDRRVDLLHDVDGDQWVGGSTSAAMPHDGVTEGGRDLIRGGPDADNIHAGFGDDVANGDSGGDKAFGDDGEDVLWGGKGCDPALNAATPDCLDADGQFDPAARGTDDRFVDHVFGGVGESDPDKLDILGSDILDFNPRGSYPGNCAGGDWPETTGSGKNATTIDPCLWFEVTDKVDADPGNDQHHHGTDWIYGGWDRDVMQGDVAGNGPNPGDRLIDWTGAYNLYTHCNAAYGGYNDIRLFAPAMVDFLTGLAWADGAGRSASDVLTPGTSAYRELAFTYNEDFKGHGVGPAYPSTPGHFDDPVSCE